MWHSVKTIVQENYENRYRLFRLALYELKAMNSGTTLGFFWNFLNPALQILVYWFVFSVGLNSTAPRGNYPYIIWMIMGIIPWFYISNALMSSTTSIYNYSSVIKRMYLPLSIVPVKTVLSAFFSHCGAMAVVFTIFLLSGYKLKWGCLWIFYYALCSIALLIGYSLLASAITVLFKDFQKIMTSVVKLLFYISPVVWVQENLPENIQFILKLNPLSYIINGYRDSILYGSSLLVHWKQGIYFWCFTLLLFLLGSCTHVRFRKKFLDLI